MKTQPINPTALAANTEAALFLKSLSGISVTVEEFTHTFDLWQRCLVVWGYVHGSDITDEAMFLRRLQECFLNSHEYDSTPDKDVNLQPFCDAYLWPEVVQYTFMIAGKVVGVAHKLTDAELLETSDWMYTLCEIGQAANAVLTSRAHTTEKVAA